MADIQKKQQSANPIQSLDSAFKAVKSVKELLKVPVVAQRYIANYEAFSGLHDGKERFERESMALMEIVNSNTEIMECDAMSIFAGFLKTAAYGIPIQSKKWSMYPRSVKQKDGSWKKFLVVDLDAHGKREALENMPNIKKIDTGVVVFKDDVFQYDPRNKRVTKHDQAWPTPKASKDTVKAVYCVVHFKDGNTQDIAMSIDQIEISRSKSKMPDGPWLQHYEEFCKKTVYNRAFKELHKLPQTAVIYKQFEQEETNDIDHTVEPSGDAPDQGNSQLGAAPVEDAQVINQTGEGADNFIPE